MAFDYKLPVNQNSSVHLWECCPRTKDLGVIKTRLVLEGGPEILKHSVT